MRTFFIYFSLALFIVNPLSAHSLLMNQEDFSASTPVASVTGAQTGLNILTVGVEVAIVGSGVAIATSSESPDDSQHDHSP